jgi:RND family efflux transporter MFP subunit
MVFTRKTKRTLIGFLFLTGIVAFLLLASFRFAEARRERQRYEQERSQMRQPTPNIHVVSSANLVQTRRYAATLRPWSETELRAEVSGRVVEVLVELGDVVQKGQPLFRIDDKFARIELERAQIADKEAHRLLAEAEHLHQSKAISDTQLQALAAEARITSASLAQAKEALERYTIRAPFDAVIHARMIDLGEMVQPGTQVAQVVDLSRLRVEFFVSEEEIGAFAPGTQVDLLIPAFPSFKASPRVSFVARSADPETRLFQVQAELPNPGLELPGGLQGVVTARIKRYANFPALPAPAVRLSAREALVWKVAPDGSTQQVRVTIGPEIDGMYPALSGLNIGDKVLIK